MGTRVVYHGDRNGAIRLQPEAMRQMFILKNAMSFQNLKQLKRVAIMSDGSRITCSSYFGIDDIHIEVAPRPLEPVTVKEAFFCWCNSCFAEGVVTEVIDQGEEFGTFYRSDAPSGSEFYPNYLKDPDSNIKEYDGVRYRVDVCQGESTQEFICIPSDFAGYEVDEEVIVLFMGKWDDDGEDRGAPLYLENFAECTCESTEYGAMLCEACMAKARAGLAGTEPDGSFIITSLWVEGINGDA